MAIEMMRVINIRNNNPKKPAQICVRGAHWDVAPEGALFRVTDCACKDPSKHITPLKDYPDILTVINEL